MRGGGSIAATDGGTIDGTVGGTIEIDRGAEAADYCSVGQIGSMEVFVAARRESQKGTDS